MIWTQLQNEMEGGSKVDNRAIIQRSLDYIEDNLQSEITAGELAEQDKYAEIFEINKRMTLWLIEKFEELK